MRAPASKRCEATVGGFSQQHTVCCRGARGKRSIWLFGNCEWKSAHRCSFCARIFPGSVFTGHVIGFLSPDELLSCHGFSSRLPDKHFQLRVKTPERFKQARQLQPAEVIRRSPIALRSFFSVSEAAARLKG